MSNGAFLTLHVGLGNFRTVDVEDLSKHQDGLPKQYIVDERTAASVNRVKGTVGKVVAIGTTVMRSLETVVSTERYDQCRARAGPTSSYSRPTSSAWPTAMVTNFHLPYSTQLMMVAAFGGYDCVMNAYDMRQKEKYRFGTTATRC